jgi:folate-binding protein YgfZ
MARNLAQILYKIIGAKTVTNAALLSSRAAFEITGPDARDFLQNILTNDMDLVGESHAQYNSLLTPQGKFLFDFFITINPLQPIDSMLVDCAAIWRDDLIKRLTMYRLRAKADFIKRDDLSVAALFGADCLRELALQDTPGFAWNTDQGYVFVDPRLVAMGARMFIRDPEALKSFTQAEEKAYFDLQLHHGIPDGNADILREKDFLLESNAHELNGVDFKKGCFIGQELVSRMRNRKMVKKRLIPFTCDDTPPEVGTILKVNGKNGGTIRSIRNHSGMAYIRVEHLHRPDAPVFQTDDGQTIKLNMPDWMPTPMPFYSEKG